MNSKLILTILISLGAAVGVFFLLRRNGGSVEGAITSLTQGCFSPPSYMKPWNENGIEWGAFSNAVRQHIGNSETNDPYVLGFLKGLDVSADPAYVKFYKKEIKGHLASNKKLPHWLVNTGMYRCDTPVA